MASRGGLFAADWKPDEDADVSFAACSLTLAREWGDRRDSSMGASELQTAIAKSKELPKGAVALALTPAAAPDTGPAADPETGLAKVMATLVDKLAADTSDSKLRG